MKNKLKILFSVVIFIGFIFFAGSNFVEADTKDDYQYIETIMQVMAVVNEKYIDSLTIKDLAEAAIEGIVSKLDPHSAYFKRSDYEDFTAQTEGKFGGLGILISQMDKYITIIETISGTPAQKVGLMAGDKIVKVEGESIIGFSTDKVIEKLRGIVGTKVNISVLRPGIEEEINVDIVRAEIKISAISYSYILDNDIAYIKVRQFNANVFDEFNKALANLEKSRIKGLIIDLRDNPGGLLDECIKLVNLFVDKNKVVVYTKGKDNKDIEKYKTKFSSKDKKYPIVVMINESSASASEIFAGSMQDWDKGLIVGKTSFGKGSVQQSFELQNGDGIKITTAKYYIHSGRCIHKDINDKLLKGEDVSKEEMERLEKEAKKQIYYTDNKRKVYGGGGITPDIEIDQDTIPKNLREIISQNLLFKYSLEFIKNENNIKENFSLNEKNMNDFMNYLKNNKIKTEE